MTSCLTLFLHMDTHSKTLMISSYIIIYCTYNFFREFTRIIGGQGKGISTLAVGNGTEAE